MIAREDVWLDRLTTLVFISTSFFIPESIHIAVDESRILSRCLDIIQDEIDFPVFEFFSERKFMKQTITCDESCDLVPMGDRDDSDRGSRISRINGYDSIIIREGKERGEHGYGIMYYYPEGVY